MVDPDIAAWMSDIGGEAGDIPPSPSAPEISRTDRHARTMWLREPLTVDGNELASITLRGVQQGDIDDWGNGVLANNRALLCRLANLDDAVIKALAWIDSAELHVTFQQMVPDFMLPEDVR